MQRLKEFVGYTKKTFGIRDVIAAVANMSYLGFNESLLIENAGISVANFLIKEYKKSNILFVCGRGGKGAVGLSVVRHILNHIDNIEIVFVDEDKMDRDITKLNYKLVEDILEIKYINEHNLLDFKKLLKWSDIVVDSIFGVGMAGLISSLTSQIINEINISKKKIISIDIPTGLNADTGLSNRRSINANTVLVLQKMKIGLLKNKSFLKKNIKILDAGIPKVMELFTGPGDVMLATHPKLKGSNKYTNGSIEIIGGSEKYKGAPILAAFSANNSLAALRVGTGYVTVFSPSDISPTIISAAPNIIVNSIYDEVSDEDVADMIKTRHNVLIIGPGMGTDFIENGPIKKLLKIEKSKNNIVVADGSAMKYIIEKKLTYPNMVFTPHYGEFRKLTGIDLKRATLNKRVRSVLEFSNKYNCCIILKGHESIITNGKLLKINMAKTPALATMGTGDVLDGIIAGYSAIHRNIFESSVAAVYVHSKIGDLLTMQKGEHIIAQDIINEIPNILKRFDVIR